MTSDLLEVPLDSRYSKLHHYRLRKLVAFVEAFLVTPRPPHLLRTTMVTGRPQLLDSTSSGTSSCRRPAALPQHGRSYAPVTPVNDEEGAPTWSPDSGQVAFGGMTQPTERTTGRLVIHILNLKTHQLSEVPGSEGLWTARWSPHGRYIAALTEDSRNLMLFDFRTTRWVKLATMLQIPDLVWSRHEEAIYFNGEVTAADRAIFRMKVPSGQLERLASLKGRTERDWLGLTPDDLPLIARYIGGQEIYTLTVNWP